MIRWWEKAKVKNFDCGGRIGQGEDAIGESAIGWGKSLGNEPWGKSLIPTSSSISCEKKSGGKII